MKPPYDNQIRQTCLAVSGYTLPLPCFFPSISSVRANLEPSEYLRMLISINYSQFLISAFDIFHTADDQRDLLHSLLKNAIDHEQIILLDSGNYESYWQNKNSWNVYDFHQVLKIEPHHLAFCFDKQDEYEDSKLISHQVENSVISSQQETPTSTVLPIIHGKQDILPEASLLVSQILHPLLLAIPERELGEGIIEGSKTLFQIRKILDSTGHYYPLHLLGTGNPLSILIYSLCGADSFDGLEWCQTAVNYETGLLYHFQQRELFQLKSPFDNMIKLPYEHSTLAHNLIFYNKWMENIRKSIITGSIIDLAYKWLGKQFCDILLNQLEGV